MPRSGPGRVTSRHLLGTCLAVTLRMSCLFKLWAAGHSLLLPSRSTCLPSCQSCLSPSLSYCYIEGNLQLEQRREIISVCDCPKLYTAKSRT